MKKEYFSKDLHKIISEFCLSHDISQSRILGFLTATLVGTMAQADYTDEFGKRTFERMYTQFLEKKKYSEAQK